MATTFDTLKFANRLKEAGIPPEQAEAQARAFAEALSVSDIATRQDLLDLKNATRQDLLELKIEMVKWMVGLAVAQISLSVGILIKIL